MAWMLGVSALLVFTCGTAVFGVALDLSQCRQISLSDISFPVELQSLNISFNGLKNLPVLPPNLRKLHLQGNAISDETLLPTNLQWLLYLDMSGNKIHSLTNWSSFPSLTHLNLSRNNIRDIKKLAFTELQKLNNLNLSSNNITVLHEELFTSLNHLKQLDLSKNRIMKLPISVFKNQSNLLLLDLSNNNLKSLENETFSYLKALQTLNLSGNQLSNITSVSFRNLSDLQILDLSFNNLIIKINVSLPVLNSLQVLNFSHNKLHELQMNSFSNVPNLQQLDLSYNMLTSLGNSCLSELTLLQRIDLSHNNFTSVFEGCFTGLTKLQTLDISFNNIITVSPGTLQWLGSLVDLNLAHNSQLEHILLAGRRLNIVDASGTGLGQIPAALTRSVRTLLLSHNVLEEIQCGDFDSYPLLEILDLSMNRLQDLEEDALGRLEFLIVLDLRGNQLQSIPKSLPASLECLQMNKNIITNLSSSDFQGLSKLKRLFLEHCGLKSIQEGTFQYLGSLEELDLSNNPLKILPSISGPVKLKILRLSTLLQIEPSTEVNEMSFPVPAPERLEVLDLIKSPGMASRLLQDTATLAAFRELQELYLKNTGLTFIRSDLFHFIPRLRRLDITGNPWNCSLDIKWLVDWINQQEQLLGDQPTCASPPHLASRQLAELYHVPDKKIDQSEKTRYECSTIFYHVLKLQASTDNLQEVTVFSNATDTAISENATYILTNTTKYSNVSAKRVLQHRVILKYDENMTCNDKNRLCDNKTIQFVHKLLSVVNATTRQNNHTVISRSKEKKLQNNHTNINFHKSVNLLLQKQLLNESEISTKMVLNPNDLKSIFIKIPSTLKVLNKTENINTMKTKYKENSTYLNTAQANNSLISNTILFNKTTLYKNLINVRDGGKLFNSSNLFTFKQNGTTYNSQIESDDIHRIQENTSESILQMSLNLTLSAKLKFNNNTKLVDKNNSSIVKQTITEVNKIPIEKKVNENIHYTNKTDTKIVKVLSNKFTESNFIENSTAFDRTETSRNKFGKHSMTTPQMISDILLNYTEDVLSNIEEDDNLRTSTNQTPDMKKVDSEFIFVQKATYSRQQSDEQSDVVTAITSENYHPGMFVLLVLGVSTLLLLGIGLTHCAKKRAAVHYSRQQDIEVRSMSNLADLW